MARRGHGDVSFAVLPQDGVELRRVGRVSVKKIHPRRSLGAGRLGRIRLIDQPDLAISRVGDERLLCAGT